MYCPNCGCLTLDKDCEWCGPASLYKGRERYCPDCGGVIKPSKSNELTNPTQKCDSQSKTDLV